MTSVIPVQCSCVHYSCITPQQVNIVSTIHQIRKHVFKANGCNWQHLEFTPLLIHLISGYCRWNSLYCEWQIKCIPNWVPHSRHRLVVADPSPQSIYCSSQNCKTMGIKLTVLYSVVFTCWKPGPRWVIYSSHTLIYLYSHQNLSLA